MATTDGASQKKKKLCDPRVSRTTEYPKQYLKILLRAFWRTTTPPPPPPPPAPSPKVTPFLPPPPPLSVAIWRLASTCEVENQEHIRKNKRDQRKMDED
ncbi:hypothetical protein RUM44_009984 [Polyplax serrata]|uniref:Uncharacterized protein n=1 Tax=Polyplax serrata TaxID=468196 RepID=A0ABR1AUA1_POLSC